MEARAEEGGGGGEDGGGQKQLEGMEKGGVDERWKRH